MSLVRCRECGDGVSSEAGTCPNCGISDPGGSRTGLRDLAAKGFLVLAALLGFLAMSGDGLPIGGSEDTAGSEDKEASATGKVGAFTACQEFVRNRLKAPATADFPCCYSDLTERLSGDRYRVDAHVDSENALGAKIRTDFVCTVQLESGYQWTLVDLQVQSR